VHKEIERAALIASMTLGALGARNLRHPVPATDSAGSATIRRSRDLLYSMNKTCGST
jgi:hypothetical protein